MIKGFFSSSTIRMENPNTLRSPKCAICGLHSKCNTPNMPPSGRGRKKILVVAEAPGKTEDLNGTQLIGDAGKRLRKLLASLHIDLDKDCWKTNAVTCRPPGNKTPTPEQILSCRPLLFGAIKDLNPKVIVLLGGIAVKSLIGKLWREEVDTLTRWTGWTIPSKEVNAWIVPTWHPSYLIRTEDPALEVLMIKHLKRAVELSNTNPPIVDYAWQNKVIVEMSPQKAAKRIRKWVEDGGLFAFDYETNCLKPETQNARILSCSISDGNTSIAYPWHGEAITASIEFLASTRCRKVAANAKFEERWSRIHAGGSVKNLVWCTMLAAHVLDNRKGITGLKFQAFVRFGTRAYDQHVHHFMQEDSRTRLNKLHSLDKRDLLLYNGMDSIITLNLALLQMKELGIES